jgi:hypothetical protein
MTAAEDRERDERQVARVFKEADRLMDEPGEDPLAPDIHPDRTRQFRSVNFSRMRTSWTPDEKIKMMEINRLADQVIQERFLDAYDIMDRLFMVVREPEMIDGKPQLDSLKRPVYKRNEAGFFIEDWSRLMDRDREQFLNELMTHLFHWSQEAAQLWGDALFAKGLWEEAFATGFKSASGRMTVDDKTQTGHLYGIEQRYFGIFQAVLSRRADALVRALERIERRLARERER